MTSTGWGIIEAEDNRIKYIDDGFIPTDPKLEITTRLDIIYRELCKVIEKYKPDAVLYDVLGTRGRFQRH